MDGWCHQYAFATPARRLKHRMLESLAKTRVVKQVLAAHRLYRQPLRRYQVVDFIGMDAGSVHNGAGFILGAVLCH